MTPASRAHFYKHENKHQTNHLINLETKNMSIDVSKVHDKSLIGGFSGSKDCKMFGRVVEGRHVKKKSEIDFSFYDWSWPAVSTNTLITLSKRKLDWEFWNSPPPPRHKPWQGEVLLTYTRPICQLFDYPTWFFKTTSDLLIPTSRRTLSQFWSIKIRGTTFPNYKKFADLLILRL